MVRIVTAGDNSLLHIGIHLVLTTPEASVEHAPHSIQGLHEVLGRVKPDVLVLDLTMPGSFCLELIPQLRRHHHDLAILVLGNHPEQQMEPRVISAGAQGYISASCTLQDLQSAVHDVASGRWHISDCLAVELASRLYSKRDDPASEPLLSEQEHLVSLMIADGATTREIAIVLHVSASTVATYRSRIIKKTGIKTTAGLTRYAIQHQS